MLRPWWVIAVLLVMPACGPSPASARTELCEDLTHLQATVAFLAAPPPDATVGDVRGALEKIDSTWQAVHDDPDVPDAEDDALLDARDAYQDQIHGVGDDDLFAPHVAATAGVARGLVDAYGAVRARLGCAASPSPSPV
jgi:hypothetical protein